MAAPQDIRSTGPFQEFFRTEAAGGALLVVCACVALVVTVQLMTAAIAWFSWTGGRRAEAGRDGYEETPA